VGADRDTTQDRVTIQEAAQRLGVKEDAIRKRIQRGSLRHEKTEEGRVFVWVDAARDATQDKTEDSPRDVPQDALAALLEAKDETIAALREQLDQANERDRENRRIIAALTSRIPEIEPPQGTPRETPSEAPEARITPSEPAPNTETPPPPETGSGRPTWWRRWFS
jgi:excisionase family DNA binding protein